MAGSSCDFCGLPIPVPLLSGGSADSAIASEPEFCCSGCRFAAAVTRESGETGAARWTLVRLGAAIFFSMNVMCFTMALWTRDVYGELAEDSLVRPWEGLLRALGLLFTAPVIGLLGLPLADSALLALRRGRLTTDLLLCAGVFAAFGYSAVSVIRDSGPVYFEVACVTLVMVTLGRWLEAQGKLQAGTALDALQKLLPAMVRKQSRSTETADRECEEEIPLDSVVPGDVVRVLPGERVPLDGRLLSTAAQLDEQLITGESLPVNRRVGDTLWAGTLLIDSPILLEVEAPASAGALQRIIDIVRQARLAKGPYQQLTDRVSAAMFPIVAILALGTVLWHGTHSGWDAGLLAGLAVVLVACPCALGLATPLAVWSGLAAAARKQVLFRSGEAVERLAEVSALRFDKTGTLTTGEPRVAQFALEDGWEYAAVQSIAARMTVGSNHPFSRAIRRCQTTLVGDCAAASGRDAVSWMPDDVPPLEMVQVAGRGLVATEAAEGMRLVLGNRSLLEEEGFAFGPTVAEVEQRALEKGESLTFLGWNGRVRAIWVFAEELRPGAQDLFDWCRLQKLDAAVLTGDHPARGVRLAQLLGASVEAGLLPVDKSHAVQKAHAEHGAVAMVGDGVNDAPALAAADVGVALGCGSDVSRDSAQVCLLSNDLSRLPWAIE
ncbi:MAG: cation-translocating P-type ATPase, partial [Planctomycetota bacterium]|nr:cation-translocating P-type ATPase [Planctomycetota bacterium]